MSNIIYSIMMGQKIVLDMTEEMLQEHLRERRMCRNMLMNTVHAPKSTNQEKDFLAFMMGAC